MRTSLRSYCYEPPRRVNIALIAPLLLVSIGFDLPPAEAQTSDPAANACTIDLPCAAGGGDCDSNTECQLGLICVADVGSRFGYKSDVDVCWIRPAGGKDSCTTANPCWAGMGNCKEDSHCDSGLHCVRDAGRPFHWGKDVGVCMPHQWKKPADKPLPTGAVKGGREKNGDELYVCRANHKGTHIGKIVLGKCHFGFGGKEMAESEYEVMVYDGADFESRYTWVKPDKSAAPPPRAVKGGQESNGAPLYVCRATHQSGLHPGKLVSGNCHISYGGVEEIIKDYQVLVLR